MAHPMDILSNLITRGEQLLLKKEELRIDNIIFGKSIYTMKNSDEVFTDMNFCLILLENAYGFSYFQSEIDYSLGKYVNRNVLDAVDKTPIFMKVAIVDAMYCLLQGDKNANKQVFKGDLRSKSKQRAKKLLERIPNGARVLLLGSCTEIIEEAVEKKCTLKILDLEEQKIGLTFAAHSIENGSTVDLEKAIQNIDYIVATGMIFVTETADKIFELSTKNDKKLILYMETGSNFGSQLIEYGAEMVLSEYFPFYDFFGETKYQIFHK